MRLVFAAALALLAAAPAIAGSSSTISVGLTVTGSFASPVTGVWRARTMAPGAMYQFVMSHSSGAFYEFVSVPIADTPVTGRCDFRISGVIHSLERSSREGASYEMTYSVQSADVVASSTDGVDCDDVAASYLSDVNTRSMILSMTGEGRLIDSATRTEYVRTR